MEVRHAIAPQFTLGSPPRPVPSGLRRPYKPSVCASPETGKLALLYEKYGLELSGMNSMNSMNSEEDIEASPSGQEPLIL